MPDLRRSLVINFFSSSGATLVHFAVSVVLTRLLSPAEIGIFSITVVVVNVAHIFRDLGVAAYLQREPDLTPDKLRSATGVLFATSWAIAGVLYLVSEFIASWFSEPAIGPVMRLLAFGFVFIPFGAITNALLTREFAADKQALIVAVGTVSYAATALYLAWLGFGAMSLAWANLVNIIASAAACVPLRPAGTPWLPSFRHWRRVMHFGVGSSASNAANAVNNAIPDMLLGQLASAHHVGLLSRANSTVSIFGQVVGSTVNYGSVSYLSKAFHKAEPLAPLLTRAIALLTGMGWPVLASVAVFGEEIVLTLYGESWLDSVPAIPALAGSAAIMMLFNYMTAGLAATGRPYIPAAPLTVMALSRVLLGILIFDGTILTFSVAILVATLLAAPLMQFLQSRYLTVSLPELVRAVSPSAMVTGICFAAALAGKWLMPEAVPVQLRLLVLALSMVPIWYLGLRCARHELAGEVNHFLRKLGLSR